MNEKINLQDLSALLAEKADITKKDAEAFLREYFEVINEELIKDGLLKIKDLGAFKLLQVEDRESIDVTTGERVLIPAHYKVAFTPDKKLAETVNEPFAFFETTEIEEDSALDDLKLLSEEEAVEEFEPTLDEEEPVIQEEPVSEENKDILPPEEPHETPLLTETPLPEPLVEEKSTVTSIKKDDCHNCHYAKKYRTYREQYYKTKKKLKRSRVSVGILSFLLAIALGLIVYQLYTGKLISFQKIFQMIAPNKPELPQDTLSVVPKTDSIAPLEQPAKKEASEKTTSLEAPEDSTKVPENPQKAPENSKQTIIAPGQRLTTIAQKEYGNKVFWIYIYIENKAAIRDPNKLPIGAKITIPPAGKYGIDSNAPASIQKAKDVAAKNS